MFVYIFFVSVWSQKIKHIFCNSNNSDVDQISTLLEFSYNNFHQKWNLTKKSLVNSLNIGDTCVSVKWVISLWPSDAIRWQRSGSTLAKAMACCLMVTSLTWSNVDLLSLRSNDDHMKAISQEIPQPSTNSTSLKITSTKIWSKSPQANELSLLLEHVQHHSITWANAHFLSTEP